MKPIQVMRYRSVISQFAIKTDEFNSNTLGNYTEYADAPANWSISGGFLSATSGVQAVLTRNGVSFADGEVSAIVTHAPSTGLVLRLLNNSNYYVAVIVDNSNINSSIQNSVTIYKRVGGTFSIVGATAHIPLFVPGTPKSLSFSAVGNKLTVKVDGVTYINATDSSILTTGLCGPRVYEISGYTHKFDSFTWP